jgi:hypothetical protein
MTLFKKLYFSGKKKNIFVGISQFFSVAFGEPSRIVIREGSLHLFGEAHQTPTRKSKHKSLSYA